MVAAPHHGAEKKGHTLAVNVGMLCDRHASVAHRRMLFDMMTQPGAYVRAHLLDIADLPRRRKRRRRRRRRRRINT